VYPYLETNVDASIMEFSQEPIPIERSATSIARHGIDTPFRPWQTIQRYVQSLVDRKGYQDFVSYNTTVELVSKVKGEWEVVLRKSGSGSDYWWKEYFDAVVVANGHYSVPYIPEIKGLHEFERRSPGSVIHTKGYRGRDAYRGKVSRAAVWVVEIFADNWHVACCRCWRFCVS
jgi:cation diffusion facilitator CzcD-associated flavoprotein CzcO